MLKLFSLSVMYLMNEESSAFYDMTDQDFTELTSTPDRVTLYSKE